VKEVEVFVPVLFKFPFLLKRKRIALEKEGKYYKIEGKLFTFRNCGDRKLLFVFPLAVFLFLTAGALYSIIQGKVYSCLVGFLPPIGYYFALTKGKWGGFFFLFSVVFELLYLFFHALSPSFLPALYLTWGGIAGASVLVVYGKKCYYLCWKESPSAECWPVFIT